MDPFHQDKEVVDFCRDHQIAYMAYSSFGTQWGGPRRAPVFSNPMLKLISEKHNASIARVVIAYITSFLNVTIIPRSEKEKHLADCFSTTTSFSLDESDTKRILQLDGILGSPWE